MDLGNAIKRAGRDDITLRSVIANKELYPRNADCGVWQRNFRMLYLAKTEVLL
jgi:hypothetical protein